MYSYLAALLPAGWEVPRAEPAVWQRPPRCKVAEQARRHAAGDAGVEQVVEGACVACKGGWDGACYVGVEVQAHVQLLG